LNRILRASLLPLLQEGIQIMDTKDTKVENTTDKAKDLAAKPTDKVIAPGGAPVKAEPAKDTTMKAEQPAPTAASKGNTK
jgi:hypothetical protein